MVDQGCKWFVNVPTNKSIEYYVDEYSFKKVLKSYAKFLLVNLGRHLTKYEDRKRELIYLAKKVSQSLKTKDNSTILASYLNFFRESYRFCEYVWAAWSVIYFVEQDVMKHFPDKMKLITSLDKPIEYQKMLRYLLTASPEAAVKRYGWLNIYSPTDPPYSVAKLAAIKKKLKKEEIENQYLSFRRVKYNFSKLLERIKDREVKKKVIAVHAYTWLKTDRVDTWKKAMFYIAPFYRYLSTLVNKKSNYKIYANLSTSEIIDLLKTGRVPSERELKERWLNKSIYYFHNKTIEIFTGKMKVAKIQHLIGQNVTREIKEIKGTVACLGKVKGRVKIITHSSDLKKIKKGDIFVAKFTFPSFTPYMLKSSAIITDEGGLTIHAAIISREYNIPCIVGTKIATQVLKDGDLVEVDAVKGDIKIIKSVNN